MASRVSAGRLVDDRGGKGTMLFAWRCAVNGLSEASEDLPWDTRTQRPITEYKRRKRLFLFANRMNLGNVQSLNLLDISHSVYHVQ